MSARGTGRRAAEGAEKRKKGKWRRPVAAASGSAVEEEFRFPAELAGHVYGRGYKNVVRIRDDTGSKLHVISPGELPPDAVGRLTIVKVAGSAESVRAALAELERLVAAHSTRSRPRRKGEPESAPSGALGPPLLGSTPAEKPVSAWSSAWGSRPPLTGVPAAGEGGASSEGPAPSIPHLGRTSSPPPGLGVGPDASTASALRFPGGSSAPGPEEAGSREAGGSQFAEGVARTPWVGVSDSFRDPLRGIPAAPGALREGSGSMPAVSRSASPGTTPGAAPGSSPWAVPPAGADAARASLPPGLGAPPPHHVFLHVSGLRGGLDRRMSAPPGHRLTLNVAGLVHSLRRGASGAVLAVALVPAGPLHPELQPLRSQGVSLALVEAGRHPDAAAGVVHLLSAGVGGVSSPTQSSSTPFPAARQGTERIIHALSPWAHRDGVGVTVLPPTGPPPAMESGPVDAPSLTVGLGDPTDDTLHRGAAALAARLDAALAAGYRLDLISFEGPLPGPLEAVCGAHPGRVWRTYWRSLISPFVSFPPTGSGSLHGHPGGVGEKLAPSFPADTPPPTRALTHRSLHTSSSRSDSSSHGSHRSHSRTPEGDEVGPSVDDDVALSAMRLMGAPGSDPTFGARSTLAAHIRAEATPQWAAWGGEPWRGDDDAHSTGSGSAESTSMVASGRSSGHSTTVPATVAPSVASTASALAAFSVSDPLTGPEAIRSVSAGTAPEPTGDMGWGHLPGWGAGGGTTSAASSDPWTPFTQPLPTPFTSWDS